MTLTLKKGQLVKAEKCRHLLPTVFAVAVVLEASLN